MFFVNCPNFPLTYTDKIFSIQTFSSVIMSSIFEYWIVIDLLIFFAWKKTEKKTETVGF